MEIKETRFIMSNSDVDKCPAPDKPEYAFIGRSNVGKSSLINMLTNKKSLAKVSGKPGKTRLINHFLINNEWYLVDLPGYGYATISVNEKKKWEKFVRNYILLRENLLNLFVLIDSRHKPLAVDLEFIEWLGMSQIPFAIVFTKTDKLNARELDDSINYYKEKLLENWETLPPYFITSVPKRMGRQEILNFIQSVNNHNKQL